MLFQSAVTSLSLTTLLVQLKLSLELFVFFGHVAETVLEVGLLQAHRLYFLQQWPFSVELNQRQVLRRRHLASSGLLGRPLRLLVQLLLWERLDRMRAALGLSLRLSCLVLLSADQIYLVQVAVPTAIFCLRCWHNIPDSTLGVGISVVEAGRRMLEHDRALVEMPLVSHVESPLVVLMIGEDLARDLTSLALVCPPTALLTVVDPRLINHLHRVVLNGA